MPEAPILIIEHSPDMAMLYRRVLEEEALAVDAVVAPVDVLAEVRRREPALLVLDVLPLGAGAFASLDQLRVDDSSREVAVVVITTSQEIAEASLASYNVRAALVKPFDLGEFVGLVLREVDRPGLHTAISADDQPASDFASYAERRLARDSSNIIFRWIQRMRGELPWSERDDLGLAELIDYAPEILKVLDVRLHYEHPAAFMEKHPDAVTRARDHALLRAEQGIGFGAALREYALLRDELWNALRANAPVSTNPDEVFEVERAINATFDAIVNAAAAAFAEEPPPPRANDELP